MDWRLDERQKTLKRQENKHANEVPPPKLATFFLGGGVGVLGVACILSGNKRSEHGHAG